MNASLKNGIDMTETTKSRAASVVKHTGISLAVLKSQNFGPGALPIT
jgi:hypothetical protein